MFGRVMQAWRGARQRGIRYTVYLIVCRVFPPALFRWDFSSIVLLDVEGELLPERAAPAGDATRLSWATSDEELRLATSFTPMPDAIRGASSTVCLAQRGGEVVGVSWLAREFFLDDELALDVQLGEAGWIHSVKVDREHRGAGCFRRMLEMTLRDSTDARVLTMYNTLNRAATGAFARYARERIATVFVLRFLGGIFCFTTGAAQRERSFAFATSRYPIRVRIAQPSRPS